VKERKDERWLDELIWRTINTTKPQFDPEQWQQKYPKEFEMLESRAQPRSTPSGESIWKSIVQNRFTKLAAAAVIIVAIGLFIAHQSPGEKVDTTKVPKVTKSPAEMLTVASLNMAYHRGGIKAVEQQCEKAVEKLGPQPAKITVKELLEEFNGI